MTARNVKKGLDVPIQGPPEQVIAEAAPVARVALLARDYVGMKPKMLVTVGDRVRLGQPLFESRKNPGVLFVAPGAGTVEAVHRGDKRALLSVVIRLQERAEEPMAFASYRRDADGTREHAQALLVESGLWTALRERPFSRAPALGSTPHAIFVTATDTHPLAPKPQVVLAGRMPAFQRGLSVLARLTDGPVYLCREPGAAIEPGSSNARVEEFGGKHPAGTAGYHIHVLDPVNRDKQVWHIGYQDVARIGHLFETGELDVSVVISLAGPRVQRPRLLRTRLGGSTDELVAGELVDAGVAEPPRVISGSVLHGDRAAGEQLGYLGRFHNQIAGVTDTRERELLGTGGSNHPMTLLRSAGVDLSQPETVQAVIAQLDSLVSRLEVEMKG